MRQACDGNDGEVPFGAGPVWQPLLWEDGTPVVCDGSGPLPSGCASVPITPLYSLVICPPGHARLPFKLPADDELWKTLVPRTVHAERWPEVIDRAREQRIPGDLECECERWILYEDDPVKKLRGLRAVADGHEAAGPDAARARSDLYRFLTGTMPSWRKADWPLAWRRLEEHLANLPAQADERLADFYSLIHTAQHLQEVDQRSRDLLAQAADQAPSKATMEQLRAEARAGMRSGDYVLARVTAPRDSGWDGPLLSWITPKELAAESRRGPKASFDSPTEILMDYLVGTCHLRPSQAARVASDISRWFLGRPSRATRAANIRGGWEWLRRHPEKAPPQP